MTGLRELKVVLDTNVIYNLAAGELVRGEVSSLIKVSSGHKDVVITWYLPEIVRNEREHQLRELARESLQAIQKLERVLGHSLGITDQIIVDDIRDRIKGQIDQLGLRILGVDPTTVDWSRMMLDAAYREPPFSPGKNEKGFRDALILEAVDQLIESSMPSRIAVVTGDELLTKAIKLRISGARHIHLLSSIEELKGLINTLVSNVDENFIDQMKTAAALFFFETENRESFIYKAEIKEKVLRDFHSTIYEVPAGMNEVQRGKTLVSRPRFKEKIGHRMYWVSRIAFRMKAFKDEAPTAVSIAAIPYSGYSGYSTFAGYSPISDDPSDIENSELSSVISVSPPVSYKLSRVPSKIGHVAFDITWSVSITPQHKLTDPQIESIQHAETSWE